MNHSKLKLAALFSVLSFVSCYQSGDSLSPYWGDQTNRDSYIDYGENEFIPVSENPISTFSIDADGASYSNVRRYIMQENKIPPVEAVRTEELINYFDLEYPFEDASNPIALNGEVSSCPWNAQNKLIRIGIKGSPIIEKKSPLTFEKS